MQSEEYRQQNLAVDNEFKAWVFEMYGLGQYGPKVYEVIYARAWESGHAYGYSEIASKFDTLMDFADDVINAYNAK